jgi:hypothetical protein
MKTLKIYTSEKLFQIVKKRAAVQNVSTSSLIKAVLIQSWGLPLDMLGTQKYNKSNTLPSDDFSYAIWERNRAQFLEQLEILEYGRNLAKRADNDELVRRYDCDIASLLAGDSVALETD